MELEETRVEKGEFLISHVPYGYARYSENSKKLVRRDGADLSYPKAGRLLNQSGSPVSCPR